MIPLLPCSRTNAQTASGFARQSRCASRRNANANSNFGLWQARFTFTFLQQRKGRGEAPKGPTRALVLSLSALSLSPLTHLMLLARCSLVVAANGRGSRKTSRASGNFSFVILIADLPLPCAKLQKPEHVRTSAYEATTLKESGAERRARSAPRRKF